MGFGNSEFAQNYKLVTCLQHMCGIPFAKCHLMVLEPIMISPEFLLQSTAVNTLSEIDKLLW